MGSIHKTSNFFHDKPLFAMDIGKSSLKVVQLALPDHEKPQKKRTDKHGRAIEPTAAKLIGYGTANFDPSAIEDGVIAKPEVIAKAAQDLFRQGLIGDIITNRVAMSIPSYRTFTRSIQLPRLKPGEMADAVRLEAEQYIPVPLEDLYLDFTPIGPAPGDGTEVLAVAVPRGIIDSYLDLSAIMGLETVLVETTMSASARLFSRDSQSDVPTVIIDFGSVSSDISIYHGGLVTSGTVEGGGQIFTDLIEKHLGVTQAEAKIIKTKYGLGVSRRQKEIEAALEPTLQKIIKEIRRLTRYHTERYGSDQPIKQVITVGGGANMPGLSDYFTSSLRLAVRSFDPWQYVNYKGFQPPAGIDHPMYATSIGLALARPREVLR